MSVFPVSHPLIVDCLHLSLVCNNQIDMTLIEYLISDTLTIPDFAVRLRKTILGNITELAELSPSI